MVLEVDKKSEEQLIKIVRYITLKLQNIYILRIFIHRSLNTELNINLISHFDLSKFGLHIFPPKTSESYFNKHLSRWILRYLAELKFGRPDKDVYLAAEFVLRSVPGFLLYSWSPLATVYENSRLFSGTRQSLVDLRVGNQNWF